MSEQHCPTCTCGCTCDGAHEPNNVMCALSELEYWSPEAMAARLAERRVDKEFMQRVNESVRVNRRLLDRLEERCSCGGRRGDGFDHGPAFCGGREKQG